MLIILLLQTCFCIEPRCIIDRHKVLPLGLQPFVPFHGAPTWIVVRHGDRVWPVEIMRFALRGGWAEFRSDHGFTAGCKVILGYERRWLFSTILLDEENDCEICLPSSIANEPWVDLHALPGHIRTSCLPLTVQNGYQLLRFGSLIVPNIDHFEVFQSKLGLMIEAFSLAEVVALETWPILVEGCRLS